jgi:hypothetical protein
MWESTNSKCVSVSSDQCRAGPVLPTIYASVSTWQKTACWSVWHTPKSQPLLQSIPWHSFLTPHTMPCRVLCRGDLSQEGSKAPHWFCTHTCSPGVILHDCSSENTHPTLHPHPVWLEVPACALSRWLCVFCAWPPPGGRVLNCSKRKELQVHVQVSGCLNTLLA